MKKQRLANFVWLVTIGAMVGGIGFWSANFANADQPTLNLFIWSDYIPPSLITGFEQECGCKVTESNYDSNAELGAKLKAGGDAEYDVVVPTDYYVSELAEEGFLQPLDHSRLSNFKNLLPEFQNPSYDPQNKYSIPYQWGTTGIVYDATKIKNPPESWALIFDPKANPNYPFVLPRGGGRIQVGAACTYLGYGFDCAEKSQWLAAAALIESTKKRPNFVGFVDETPARDEMKSGQIAVSFAYSGDIGACIADNSCPKMKFFLPKEGTNRWVDTMAVPAHAPHPQLALEFINFILAAHNGADLSNYNQYSSPNQASQAFLQASLKNDVNMPTAEENKKLQFLPSLHGAQYKLFNDIWTEILQ